MQKAQSVFKETNIKITAEDQWKPSCSYWARNIQAKIRWRNNRPMVKVMRVLCKIEWCESQATYSGFIKGFKHKPIYFMRAIPNIKNQIKQLDDVIPAITGGISCSDIERILMCLPPRFGGPGIQYFWSLHKWNTISLP